MSEIILKVLDEYMQSPFRFFKFELGVWYRCDDFCNAYSIDCAAGFYATGIEGLPYSFNKRKGSRVFVCKVKGKNVNYDIYKRRWEYIKLVREIDKDTIKQLAFDKSADIGYDLVHAIYPVNPLTDIAENEITREDIDNLRKWDYVRTSMRNSVWESVNNYITTSIISSVRASIRSSLWEPVGEHVNNSVRRSVWNLADNPIKNSYNSCWIDNSIENAIWAYLSSLFPNIKKWESIDHEEEKNPFHPCIDLWMRGFVPSFDGKVWRLHQGKDAKIVYEYPVEYKGV